MIFVLAIVLLSMGFGAISMLALSLAAHDALTDRRGFFLAGLLFLDIIFLTVCFAQVADLIG